jgi:hypothetical protein
MMANGENFFITDTDREWVHHCFEWLVKGYGYPSADFEPVLFSKKFFPLTLSQIQANIDPLLTDLCRLFKINRSIISFEIEEDIRDTHGTPYEFQDSPFECEVEQIKQGDGYHYKFHFANSTLKNPKRALFHAVFQFIKIKLSLNDPEWMESNDHYFLFYLIGIYTGWGVILTQTMTDIGHHQDGLFWEQKWKYISPMPVPVMAYSLALHSCMREEYEADWKSFLPTGVRSQYEKAVEFIRQNPNPVINKGELTAKTLFKESFRQSNEKDFDKSIETCRMALFLTSDDQLKASLHNKIAYTLLLKGEFKKAIAGFQKAIELNANALYVYDNLSFAFIMLDDADTGKYYHSLAQGHKRVKAYAYRNLALYHQKREETEKARENFQQAFEHITIPVDWLEYLYARFLFEQGEKEEALLYLQMAVDKGEPKAVEWMHKLNEGTQ